MASSLLTRAFSGLRSIRASSSFAKDARQFSSHLRASSILLFAGVFLVSVCDFLFFNVLIDFVKLSYGFWAYWCVIVHKFDSLSFVQCIGACDRDMCSRFSPLTYPVPSFVWRASMASSSETVSTSTTQVMAHNAEPVVSADWLHVNLRQPNVKVIACVFLI